MVGNIFVGFRMPAKNAAGVCFLRGPFHGLLSYQSDWPQSILFGHGESFLTASYGAANRYDSACLSRHWMDKITEAKIGLGTTTPGKVIAELTLFMLAMIRSLCRSSLNVWSGFVPLPLNGSKRSSDMPRLTEFLLK